MEKTASIHLTPSQIRKLQQNKVFQVSADQMDKPANVTLKMHKSDHTRLQSNIRAGRGFRFATNMASIVDEIGDAAISGGRLSFKKIGRSIGRSVGKAARATGNAMIDSAADQFQQDTGLDLRSEQQMRGKFQKAKRQTIADLKEAGIEAATTGTSGLIGVGAAAIGSELGGPAGGIIAARLADEYISKPLNKKTTSAIEGAGFKRFAKGSQEAKDYMAMIRAKKGGATKPKAVKAVRKAKIDGGSFRVIGGALPGAERAYIQNDIVHPTGGGEYMRINRMSDRVNNPVRGGSFRTMQGGSFMPM